MRTKQRIQVLSRILLSVLIAALALMLVACDKPTPAGGEKTFTFLVYDEEGTLVRNESITSDALYVGEALQDEGLIEGEAGPYGLYVKTVCGIFAEYETTGSYWSFYIDGAYGTTGVDTTPIENGATYAFKVEK